MLSLTNTLVLLQIMMENVHVNIVTNLSIKLNMLDSPKRSFRLALNSFSCAIFSPRKYGIFLYSSFGQKEQQVMVLNYYNYLVSAESVNYINSSFSYSILHSWTLFERPTESHLV